MDLDDRILVLERLKELEGWSEYITEALHLNRKSEPVKREMLERAVADRELRQIRELSWALRDKLHVITTELEHSASAPVGTLPSGTGGKLESPSESPEVPVHR